VPAALKFPPGVKESTVSTEEFWLLISPTIATVLPSFIRKYMLTVVPIRSEVTVELEYIVPEVRHGEFAMEIVPDICT
jgi:hypothetical protein